MLCVAMMALGGCDYLDKAPTSDLPEDKVFSDARFFRQFVDNIYRYLWYSPNGDWTKYAYGGFCRIQLSCLEDATDLSDAARSDSGVRMSFNRGDWSGYVEPETQWTWTAGYKVARACNKILEHVDVITGLSDEERAQIKGQAYFFRGFFFFEMIKRFGGVPYIDEVLAVDEDMNFPRDSYDYCTERICEDFDMAASLLPEYWDVSEFGRPEKGAALGYKARALLYAASPLNNPTNDLDKWKKAAEAAYDVIAMNHYRLLNNDEYRRIFYGTYTNDEIIFSRNGGSGTYYQSCGFGFTGWGSFSLGVGARPWSDEWGSTPCPTQNFVDMFEMDNGQKPILGYEDGDGTKPIINPASGYSEEKMYEHRDPRFYYIMIINGDPWMDATSGLELWFDENGMPGKHIQDGENWTRTGYLEKKFWDPALTPQGGSTYLNFIFMRYTDIILMYAEAMNEAFGPDVDGLGTGMTARDAVNMVRNRVNHVDVIAQSQDELRERIRNERAIEFIYEDHRWFDVIRWKKGVEIFNSPVYGIRTTKHADGTYSLKRRKIQDRVFSDCMHRYPIPQDELNKNPNLVQNEGWEGEAVSEESNN